ncbi:MAG: CDP-alcohol phosphatidyltransferase family protein [Desulfobacterales bacterium]|nr:CDP-alcohol phosphatidyltransferase family protein [Desulfobacterales bacterium]MDJ0888206.1 CDP-alcohol phosphatidyltransferase family protein [Desulfobacterales bacterium]
MNRTGFVLNWPNVLTLARILITPLFIICLIKGSYAMALLVFTLAGVTDGLDGLLARLMDQRTTIGAFLDPIADKLLLVSAFVTLAVQEMIPAWLTVVVISRDVLIIVGIAILEVSRVDYQIQPSMVSKCTTVAQLATIFLLLLSTQTTVLAHALLPVYWLTTALSIASGLHYVYLGIQIMPDAENGSGPGNE